MRQSLRLLWHASRPRCEGGELRVSAEPRVWRPQGRQHQRVFRWGVGNKFRALPGNRFRPTHMPHPKEITVPDDYYDSPDPAIIWEDLNEFWEVYWYEHGKLNARPFPVKKHGLFAAKKAAIEYLAELRGAGRCHNRPDPQAQVADI